MKTLAKDPLTMAIIGVAGQGNVVISLFVSQVLVKAGYHISFGQIYGGSQRGGPVQNFVVVSKKQLHAPIPQKGKADIILALEPLEALRMLSEYGNPDVITIVNPRPIHSFEAISGRAPLPDYDKLIEDIKALSGKTVVINATDEAIKLGNRRAANIIFLGALLGTGALPLDKKDLEPEIKERFPKAVDLNMNALSRGMELMAAA